MNYRDSQVSFFEEYIISVPVEEYHVPDGYVSVKVSFKTCAMPQDVTPDCRASSRLNEQTGFCESHWSIGFDEQAIFSNSGEGNGDEAGVLDKNFAKGGILIVPSLSKTV